MIAAPLLEVRHLAKACVRAISETLITETRDVNLPAFKPDRFQRRLIESKSRFIRVVAPAGSGKTRSLAAKAAHILATDPDARILCLTFTNAAVHELIGRVAAADNSARDRTVISTVNAFGYQLLRKFVPRHKLAIPDSPEFGIACAIVRDVLEENPLSTGQSFYQRYTDIIEFADLTKSYGFGLTDSAQDAASRFQALEYLNMSAVLEAAMHTLGLLRSGPGGVNKTGAREIFASKWLPFWQKLVKALWSRGLITLEDQKYRSFSLLARDPKAQQWIRAHKLTHVMVDEFQDINYLDLYLISQLTILSNASLYIVGDDDQCIYEWRGCTSHFLREPDLYLRSLGSTVAFETIKLEQNYRCPKNVVDHASRLIARNESRISKQIIPVRQDDANIRVISLPAAYLTMHVVDELVAPLTQRHPSHSIAILGRKKSQLMPLQILFTKRETKFYVDKDLNLFLGDAFADFRQLIARVRMAHMPRPTSQVVQDFFILLHRLHRNRVSNRETSEIDDYLSLKQPKTLRECVDQFSGYKGEFKGGGIQPSSAAEQLAKYLEATSVVEALQIASATFKAFARDFVKSREDIFYSDPPFSHLIDLAADYDDRFEAFVADLDRTRKAAAAHSKRGVARIELLTALRGKGREFDTVIVLDANDGIWPNGQAVKNGLAEEERRLFYVAISRARANLLLFESGRVQGKRLAPSPFLAEMELPDSAWLRHPEITPLSRQLLTSLRI
jgi:DNA helicase II / ATP-dependent DNA helicase PcrA